jgi:hypothetical protein
MFANTGALGIMDPYEMLGEKAPDAQQPIDPYADTPFAPLAAQRPQQPLNPYAQFQQDHDLSPTTALDPNTLADIGLND